MIKVKFKKHISYSRAFAVIAGCAILFGTAGLKAQSPEIVKGNLSSWFLLLNRFQITRHFSITNELHERTGSFLSDQGQFLWRPSIDYSVNKNIEFSVGYSLIHVDPYAPFNQKMTTTEDNIWEQVFMKWDIGKVHFANRFRLEERYVPHVVTDNDGRPFYDTYDHKNRFRYRFILNTDLVTFKNKQSLFLMAWDEYWLNMRDKTVMPESFTRNWAYLGLGYKFNQSMNLQLGYMNQIDRVNDNKFVSTPIMQLTFVKNFDFSNKTEVKPTVKP